MSKRAGNIIVWSLTMMGALSVLWLSIQWLQLKPPSIASDQSQPDIVLSQSELTHFDQLGRRVWTIFAELIELDEESRSTVAEGVEVWFWSEENETTSDAGDVALVVTSKRLTLDNLREDLTFDEGLQATDNQGLIFTTQNARWSNQEQVLEGDADVRVEQADLLLEGTGFRYDVQNGKLLIKEDAQLRWILPKP